MVVDGILALECNFVTRWSLPVLLMASQAGADMNQRLIVLWGADTKASQHGFGMKLLWARASGWSEEDWSNGTMIVPPQPGSVDATVGERLSEVCGGEAGRKILGTVLG